ncbi:CDP-alcohol phosphatidyltransferase family protein [Roseibium sp. AS2]|uniref:CDP-alcohol phosphatidyltransferase family protein n=1 Tax=Roseibium sp. AS2 TaxID=3135781 RepID=UPI00316DF1C2
MPATFLTRYVDRANSLTAANAALGILAISAALGGWVSLAATLIVIAASLDHIDGWIARRYCGNDREARQFGGHLDTLADVVDFSLAPVILLLAVSGLTWITISAAVFFVLTGIGRLAHFEIVGAEGGRRYIGLPTTYAAYLLCFPVVLTAFGFLPAEFLPAFYVVAGALQIANATIIKPPYFITVLFMPAAYLTALVVAISLKQV